LQDLDEAVRQYLAWDSILGEKEKLDLPPHQVRQAETQKSGAEDAVTARIPEAYQWLLVPTQPTPQSTVEWQGFRLTGQDSLAVRASKKLKNDALLLTSWAPSLLKIELDKIPLWRGEHVAIKQLVEDYGRYIYLSRLKDASVLLGAVRDGIALFTWEKDSFAYADSFDEATRRYRGLRCGTQVAIVDADAPGLLVKAELARKQLDLETTPSQDSKGEEPEPHKPSETQQVRSREAEPAKPKRYHGTVTLDPTRVGRDASLIADEVISHLSGLVGANVKVTLEIEAEIPSGAPDHVVRTVTENSRTLKFSSQGFEKE
jgi:hypothetical protein